MEAISMRQLQRHETVDSLRGKLPIEVSNYGEVFCVIISKTEYDTQFKGRGDTQRVLPRKDNTRINKAKTHSKEEEPIKIPEEGKSGLTEFLKKSKVSTVEVEIDSEKLAKFKDKWGR